VIVQGVSTKREKHEAAPLLIVGDEGCRMMMIVDRVF
jgi:hypothetical protein